MKNIWFWLLLVSQVLGQTVPGTYPYPVPLPTTGSTPAATAKASGPVNPVGYADNRPGVWDVFHGGGMRSVSTTSERDAILSGRRKQGMLVWVAADNHLYQLDADLTTWIDLGTTVSSVLTPIYRGQATGGPGAFTALNANIDPDYTATAIPPEYTVVALKFDAESDGPTTLTLGNSATSQPIRRPDGSELQVGDISPGRVVLLTRSGTTSGSVWTLQAVAMPPVPAPPNDMVAWVEDSSLLASSTAGVVITKGYFTAGDGGSGAYRLDSSSVDTINNITVFDCTEGGRYILINSGSISAKQAGVVADGITDDHDALQDLFDVSPNLTVRLEPGEYRSVGGLTLPDHVKVIARGADLTCETTGEDRAIDMGSWCSWIGGTVRAARQSGGSSGQDHCSFRIGDWKGVINHGVSNVVIRDVVMTSSGNFGSAGAYITQNSHNVEIDNFEIPASATQGNGITVHWGFVTFAVEADGTRHPHNIRVRNGNIGAMTTTTFEGNAVACSAGYNVSFENIKIDRCRYPIESTVGDFGFQYSGLTQLDLGSVSFKNITCLYVYNYGAYIRSEQTFDTDKHNLNHVIENCTLIGANAGAGQGGLWIDSARNVMIKDTVIAGHEYGTIFTNGCSGVTFDNVLFATNRLGGLVGSDPNTKNVTVRNCDFQNNSWGLSGNNAAGIILIAGSDFRIVDNDIGHPVSEPNQEVGLKIIPTFLNATVTGNKVLGVKGGGVNIGYYFGSASDTGHLYLVQGNSAVSGITLISGPDQIPFLTRGTLRDFTGTGTPTVGAYLQGDRVILNTATSTPFAKICTVAGSPGTWVDLY